MTTNAVRKLKSSLFNFVLFSGGKSLQRSSHGTTSPKELVHRIVISGSLMEDNRGTGDDDSAGSVEQDLDVSDSHLVLSHYATVATESTTEEDAHVVELKHRISQLEHLVVTSTLTASPFLDSSTVRLTPHGLVQRVGQLESLLAASELDNHRLEHEVELIRSSKQECIADFYRKVKDKENRIKNLEHDLELMNVQQAKNRTTISSMEAYIHTLPSQQELDDINQLLLKSYLEVDTLHDRVERLKVSLQETRKASVEQEILHTKDIQRLEELLPLEEAHASIIEGSQNETSLLQLATLQKTQLLKATKIIRAQRRSMCNMETERAELLLQLIEKGNSILSLEASLESSQRQLEATLKQLKNAENDKHHLEAEMGNLRGKITENENWIRVRNNEMTNLLRLVAEVDFGVEDLAKLIAVCQSLGLGGEPALEDILGLDFDHDHDAEELSEVDTVVGFEVDDVWILGRLKMVRESRDQIRSLRKQVNDIYSDILGSGGRGCDIQ